LEDLNFQLETMSHGSASNRHHSFKTSFGIKDSLVANDAASFEQIEDVNKATGLISSRRCER
jgi:hypothetical protein